MVADKGESVVKLLAEVVNGQPVFEEVPALLLRDNRYRILASPGFAPGVAAGDEIELSSTENRGFRIVKRSGNVCIQVFLGSSAEHDESRITAIVKSIGGRLDGGFVGKGNGQLLVYNVPVNIGFGVIEATMNRIQEECAIEKWMYGNVYDPDDGVTPLNWWR
jgi:hypothetical protein